MSVAHVQTIKTIDNDGTASVTTSAITLTGGNLLLVGLVAADNVNDPAITSITLSGGGTFTVDQTALNTGWIVGFRGLAAIASLPNVSGGSHTVTVNFANNVAAATVFLTEVSGAATSSPADGTGSSGISAVGGTAAASGAFTTSNSDDFWYAVVGNDSGNATSTFTAGAGWTIPTNGSELDGSVNQTAAVEYQANPGATSGNGQFTIDNTNWAAVAFAYKAAAAGGGRPRVPAAFTMLGVC